MTKTIAVIAPANTMRDISDELRSIALSNLERMGFGVIFGKNVDRSCCHTAGTVEERISDFRELINDPNIDIIMPAFGGYNSNQLLDHIDYEEVANSKKMFVGYSDITAMIIAIGKLCPNKVIHGPSFATFCDPEIFEYTIEGFKQIIEGTPVIYRSSEFVADDLWYKKKNFGPREIQPFAGWKVFRKGYAQGTIIGGNIETLCSLAGTRYFPAVEDSILFLEDATGNNPAIFHRYMTQLSQMGVFLKIRGLIIGKFPNASPLNNAPLMQMILSDVLRGRDDMPMLLDVNCSHVDPMMSIPCFSVAELITEPEPILKVNLGATVKDRSLQ